MLARWLKIFILSGLMATGFINTALATVIVIAPPIPRNMIMQPRGYERCYTIPSGWYQGVWVNRHQVCQYSHVRRPQVWVDGYWRCNRFRHRSGNCAHWRWVPSHWAHRNVIY
jgi:hypothetical protein